MSPTVVSHPVSMTGFGQSRSDFAGQQLSVTIRSVNGKSLDVKMRLPPVLDLLDGEIKSRIKHQAHRGSVQVQVSLAEQDSGPGFHVNHEALDAYVAAVQQIAERIGGTGPPPLELILAQRGIIEHTSEAVMPGDAAVLPISAEQLIPIVDSAIGEWTAARAEEGVAIVATLQDRLEQMSGLVARAQEINQRSNINLSNRLKESVQRLTDVQDLEPDRLHQEAIILATKADVQEELDRLVAHIAQAHKHLTGPGPVGRKLEFLTQEFNREANTLCSKASHLSLTEVGLELKSCIDQFREQILNLE